MELIWATLCVHAGGRDIDEGGSYDKRRAARDIIKQTTCHLDDDPVWHSPPSLPTSFIQLEESSWAHAFGSCTFSACLIQISGRNSSIFSWRGGLLPAIIIISRELCSSKSLVPYLHDINFLPPLPRSNYSIRREILSCRLVRQMVPWSKTTSNLLRHCPHQLE